MQNYANGLSIISKVTGNAFFTLFPVAILILGLTACASRPTQFTVDPEVYPASIHAVEGKAFMLKVVAPKAPPANSDNTQYLIPANDFTNAIKQNVIKAMIKKGYSISANKHFSDFVMTLDFSQVDVAIHTGMVKDKLEVQSKLIVNLTRKNQSYRKSFSRSQTLIVALKATDVEITGLTNQVVGHLLESAFNDSEIVEFINGQVP